MHTVKQPLKHTQNKKGEEHTKREQPKKNKAGKFHSVSSFLKDASSQSPPQHPHEWWRQIKKKENRTHTVTTYARAFFNAKTQFVHNLDNLLPCDNKKKQYLSDTQKIGLTEFFFTPY